MHEQDLPSRISLKYHDNLRYPFLPSSVAFGSTIGVAIIDYIQKTQVMVIFNYELSGIITLLQKISCNFHAEAFGFMETMEN